MLDFDRILQEIGEFGRYQQLVTWLLCIPACILNAYNGYGLVFLMYTPKHVCALSTTNFSSNTTTTATTTEFDIVAEECSLNYFKKDSNHSELVRSEPCTEWIYDKTYFESTIITQWNLVCDKSIQPKIVLSVFGIATVVGCLIYSYIQDRWGRKLAFMISLFTYILGSTISLYMPTLTSFTVIRLFAAINTLASWNISYIWALEYVGPSKRTFLTTMMCIVYALGMMSMSLIAFLCRTWVQMGLVMTLPFIALVSFGWIIHESPRWLLTKGKIQEAQEVINCMMKWDKKPKEADSLIKLLKKTENLEATEKNVGEKVQETGEEANDKEKEAGVLDLFRSTNMRRKTFLVMIAYVSNAVVYTSIAYNTENLGENLYLTWLATSFVEGPGGLLFLYVADRYGRIIPHGFGMILAGIVCILTAPGEYLSSWLVISLAMLGKLIICITYAIICQLSGELFPTVVRGVGVGLGSVVGDAGNIAMPYIIHSAETYKMLPMLIMGALAIVGGATSFFLPETLNQYMPETIKEAEVHGTVGLKTVKGHFKRLFKRGGK